MESQLGSGVIRKVYPREPSFSTWPTVPYTTTFPVLAQAPIWAQRINQEMTAKRCTPIDVTRFEWLPEQGWMWPVVDTIQKPQTPTFVHEMTQTYATAKRRTTGDVLQTWTPGVDWLWVDTLSAAQQSVAAWQSQTQQEYALRKRPQMEPYRWWQPERTDWLYGPATANLPRQWPAIESLLRNAETTPRRRVVSLRDDWLPGFGWVAAVLTGFDPQYFPRVSGEMTGSTLSGRVRSVREESGQNIGWIVATFPAFDPQFFPRVLEAPWLWKPRPWPYVSSRLQAGITVPPPEMFALEMIATNAPPSNRRVPGGDHAQGIGWIAATFPQTFDPQYFPRLPETLWLWKPKPWPAREDRHGVTLIILPPGLGVWNAPEPFMTPARARLRNERLSTTEFWGILQAMAQLVPFDAAREQLFRSEATVRKRAVLNVRLYEWHPELGWITTLIPPPPIGATPVDFLVWLRRRRR